MPDSMIKQVYDEVKKISKVVLGNGEPEKGLCWDVAELKRNVGKINIKLDKHLKFCSENHVSESYVAEQIKEPKEKRNLNSGDRKSDKILQNKKWRIMLYVSIAALVLGNLSMIGVALHWISDFFLKWAGAK